MTAATQLTPMMAQYRRIKGELPKDALLLFRLGDCPNETDRNVPKH